MEEPKQPEQHVSNEHDNLDPATDATAGLGQQAEVIAPETTRSSTDATDINLSKFSTSKHNKLKVIGLVILIIAFIAMLSVSLLVLLKNDDKQTVKGTHTQVVLMGAEISVVDGSVQISTDKISWRDAKTSDQVAEGSYLKTAQAGRAVITLDDGSAIRINSNSLVKIDSLNTKNIVITNESGTVYTRVVKSDRQFSVNVDDEKYVAMGTAYITVNTADSKGVEVYESKVKLTKNNTEVPEGKYFYSESKNLDQTKKLNDIPLDKIQGDTFLAWNYQQDKSSNEFKNNLGILSKIDAPKPTLAASPSPTAKPTTASGIKLSGVKYDSGVKLSWSLSGVSATKGFKVVKSLSANPTYGKDSYQYVSDPSARSYAWSIKDGKSYHFRVCIYNGETCTDYSNDITVTTPLVEQVSETPNGSLVLTHNGGKNFSWTLSGSAPYGYKLVWSTSGSPVYPGSAYSYFSTKTTMSGAMADNTPAGTYNVRICMYNNGTCLNYSNQITVTIP